MMDTLNSEALRNLSNQSLTQRLKNALATEREAISSVLTYLDEYDRRLGYEEDGYRSLFKYLTDALHLAESSAATRIAAMRLIRKHPFVQERLADGSIHLTGVYQVAKYLNEENAEKVISDCTHRSKEWIDEYLRQNFHAAATGKEKRDVIRPISKPIPDPVYSAAVKEEGIKDGTKAKALFDAATSPPTSPPLQEKAPGAPIPSSLLAKTMRISTDLDAETYEDLKRARELLGAKDFGAVIGKALKHLLKKIEPCRQEKVTEASKPKAKVAVAKATTSGVSDSPKSSRYIPKEERDAVTRRDGYRCSHVSPDGKHRCTETVRLQLDHIVPFAKGGTNTANNLQWVCDTHNRMRARQIFGADFMAKKIDQRRKLVAEAALFQKSEMSLVKGEQDR